MLGKRYGSEGNQLKQFEAKVSAAEERRMQLTKEKLDRVANHNKKVMELKQRESPEKTDVQLAAKL